MGRRTLPKAEIRFQYLGPGTFGKYIEYSRATAHANCGYLTPNTPTRVARTVTMVSGHPTRMVFHIKWAGHQQGIVLTPTPPAH